MIYDYFKEARESDSPTLNEESTLVRVYILLYFLGENILENTTDYLQ